MVGLVVVSHSRALAQAAVALAGEMVPDGEAVITVAAGLDADTFGTDAVQVADAITAADHVDGVVVLMDLGSAVLSAELALDLLDDDDLRGRVTLCPAPLVEGLVVAAVAAAAGASAAEVAAEATGALAAKRAHLATPGPGHPAPAAGSGDRAAEPVPGEIVDVLTVRNPHGLHARPAALLVHALRAYDARVLLRNRTTGSDWLSAASLSAVVTLDVRHGHQIEVAASGSQAREAVAHLVALVSRAFDEAPDAAVPRSDDESAGGSKPSS